MILNNKIFISIVTIFILIGFLSFNNSYGVNRKDFGNITLDLKDVDILDVLKIFSMHSGMSIVAGQDVRAKVTIFLKDVNAWDAFEVILAANNLTYKEDGGIVKVLTERNYIKQYGMPFYDKTIVRTVSLKNAHAEDVSNALNQIRSELGRVIVDARSNTVILKDTPEMIKRMQDVINSIAISPETKVFTLKYADAEEMMEKVKEQLTEGIGSVEVDKRTGKIVVTDIPPKIEQITKILDSFDEKSREVLIEAKIVEVTLDREYRLGIDWENIFSSFNLGVNVIGGDLEYYTNVPANGFQLIMDAFKTMGDTRVISQPKILALNHKEANIKITDREPYVTTTVAELGQDSTQVAESVTFIDVGTQLSVTPTINPDGYITMEIKPKISSVGSTFTYKESSGGEDREIPIERTTEVETTIMVKDGMTIIIGGLMKEESDIDKKKIPVLGNIPFLGGMFRHSVTDTQNTELAIFITPHIISGDESFEITRLEDNSLIQSSTADNKTPTFSWLKKGEKSAYTDYYLALSSMLSEYIAENYIPSGVGGRVNLILTLDSSGRVLGQPQVIDAADPGIASAAKKLIVKASPFLPFPEELDKRQEDFRISINLPSVEGRLPLVSSQDQVDDFYDVGSSDIAYSEYYLTLSEIISNYMISNYPSTRGGSVEVSFKLSSKGKLIGRPTIVSEVNPQLRELTIQAMRELSPFPPFPDELDATSKTFRILITIPGVSKNIKVSKGYASGLEENRVTSFKPDPSYISYDDYKRDISRKISNFIDSSFQIEGEATVAFTVNVSGKLVGIPEILSSSNREFSEMVIQAIRKASPFPKLPPSVAKDQAVFEISVVYK